MNHAFHPSLALSDSVVEEKEMVQELRLDFCIVDLSQCMLGLTRTFLIKALNLKKRGGLTEKNGYSLLKETHRQQVGLLWRQRLLLLSRQACNQCEGNNGEHLRQELLRRHPIRLALWGAQRACQGDWVCLLLLQTPPAFDGPHAWPQLVSPPDTPQVGCICKSWR